MPKKNPAPDNFGWSIADDGTTAEKTASFGTGPVKTHRLYGVDKDDVQGQIEDFETRLKAANGEDE